MYSKSKFNTINVNIFNACEFQTLKVSCVWSCIITLVARVSYTFMLWFFVFLQVSCPRSSILASIARVSHAFMLWFLMSLQIWSFISSILALITGVYYTFMLRFFILLESWSCCSRVLALVAGYLIASCLASLCRFRSLDLDVVNSHLLHWNFVFFAAFSALLIQLL